MLSPLPEKGQLFLKGKRTNPEATNLARKTGQKPDVQSRGELAQVIRSVCRGFKDSKLNLPSFS